MCSAKRLCVYIVVVGLILSCSSRRSEPVKGEKFVPSNESIERGEVVFMQYCQRCHPAGEAGLGPAINSNPAPQFIKRFQVRHGLGAMPSFSEEQISKEDLKNISAYLKAWKKY